jgi:hypothetical protein
LHKLEDPTNQEFYEGKMMKIMVHPAILAIGTHDGDHYDYDHTQVLAKAVVWLDA